MALKAVPQPRWFCLPMPSRPRNWLALGVSNDEVRTWLWPAETKRFVKRASAVNPLLTIFCVGVVIRPHSKP